MFVSDRWKDYEILDATSGEKLERWGDYLLVRPDPQVIWDTQVNTSLWNKKNAHYHRSNRGGGKWEFFNLPKEWKIRYELITGDVLSFNLKPFSFKHTGLFPEQACNWDFAAKTIADSNRQISVLNLFAYTGGATLACAASGAKVTHVDASKGMVTWAKENSVISGIADRPIRWLVDDCKKFVERELRRKNRYDAIILDPPSYGRGPKGETWKLEDQIYEFLCLLKGLLSDKPLFFILNSYTTGLQPGVLTYLCASALGCKASDIHSDEVMLPVTYSRLNLPCGACARIIFS